MIGPFTGAASLSLAAPADLEAIRPARLHAYFDTVVTAGVSTVGFLQLVGLTVLASALTLDGDRTGALLLAWLLWPVLILLTAALVWLTELVRRCGRRARVGTAVGALVLAAGAAALAATRSPLLAAPGAALSRTLSGLGRGELRPVPAAVVVCVVSAAGLLLTGLGLCQAALARPAAGPVRGTRVRRRSLSEHPRVAMAQVLVRVVLRTPEVRRPLLAVAVLGVPAVWLSGGDRLVMTTLVLATPLAVALAWGVNAFGVLGAAMPWLASQPTVVRPLLGLVAGLQLLAVAALAILCWVPPWIAGVVDTREVAAVAAGLAVSTAVTVRSAAAKAVARPYAVRLAEGGDTIVPPLAATNYALRLALWGGQLGVIVLSRPDPRLQGGLVVAAVLWSAVRYAELAHRWANRAVQAHVVATVAAP